MNKITALTFRTFVICLLLCHAVPAATQDPKPQAANLHEAVEAKDAAAVKTFLDAGADPGARDASGWTPLTLAAQQKSVEIVKLLLDKGADPNARVEEAVRHGDSLQGFTALMVAAIYGSEGVVKLLIDKRADVNAKDASGLSVLWHSTASGHLDISRLLLRQNAEPDIASPNGKRLLLFAARKPDEELVRMLLERGADPNVMESVGWRDKPDMIPGSTPLLYVAAAGNDRLARLLIEKGADIHAVDEGKISALEHAAHAGAVDVMRTLLAKGADPNHSDSEGRTPLIVAVLKKHADAVTLLIEHKADVNVLTKNTSPPGSLNLNTSGVSPLILAADGGDPAIVKLLVENGAEVNKTALPEAGAAGTSALARAALNGRADIVKLLLEHKADPNLKDAKGRSPLGLAAYQANMEVIRLLVGAGADVNYQDEETGWTPLMAAANANKRAAVETLLATKSTDLNKRSRRRRTALILASRNSPDPDNAAIIKALLDAGADYNAFEDQDKNAMMYAAEKGNEAVISLLVAKGADIDGRNKGGRTPFMYAVASLESVFNRTIESMIAMRADINARDSEGDTPLLTAARRGRAVTAELLLARGAALNARDKAGNNALIAAAGSKWRGEEDDSFIPPPARAGAIINAAEMILLLLGRGMDVNSVNAAGETALMLAASREDESGLVLVGFLLEKGASLRLRDKAGKTARARAEETGNLKVAKVLADAEAGKVQRGASTGRGAPARDPAPKRPAGIKEPSETFWTHFVVPEKGKASVAWIYTNRAQDRMMRTFVADLTAAGFERDESSRDPKQFWARLDVARKEQLKRKHAALFTSYEEAGGSNEIAQLLAPQLSSLLRRMRGSGDGGGEGEDEFAEAVAELDRELAKLMPQVFIQLRNKGIGMDADTVNRLLGDFLKGPTIRSLRGMIAEGRATDAWNSLEAARSAPFTLLQQKRPVLVEGQPKRYREDLARVNLDIVREQQKFLRLADEFRASGGKLGEVFPAEDEEGRLRQEEAPASEGAQQLLDAHHRVRNLFVRRMGLIAELVNTWGEGAPSVTARQAAEQLPAGTLSVVFAYETNPLRLSLSKSDKIHVFMIHGGARAEGEEAHNLTPPILIRTLELSPVELSREMSAFRAVVTHSNTSAEEVASKGRRLFAALFPGEMGDTVRGAQRLVLSPDGPLWDMPFAALVTNTSGKPSYLGLEKPISYTASLTQLNHLKKLPPRLSQGQKPFALVLGDPNFNRAAPLADSSLLVRSFLDPLPATRGEAEYISKLYGAAVPSAAGPGAGGVLLLGDEATESALRRWVERADVIHLATHGYIDTARQLTMNSGVWLTPPVAGRARHILADDGALQAAEVFNQLKLRADLVVISACEMGRGQDLKGAGVADMIWALHAAGARSVVASQWEVADQSTRTLMSAFHELVCGGADKDEALMKALGKMYGDAKTAHPYYWAPFVVSGDTRTTLPPGGARCVSGAAQ